ncbi:MAG: YopX family protein [Negativicutes bacterium]|nr:YopX family protein [Negativicutes bacterium]
MLKNKFRAWDHQLKTMLLLDFLTLAWVLSCIERGDRRYVLMQGTGLCDRGGCEIYEGDCVQVIKGIGVVELFAGCFDVVIKQNHTLLRGYTFLAPTHKCCCAPGDHCLTTSCRYFGCKVIGNIYEKEPADLSGH